ncbi:DNA damage-inducible protein 1 [Gurleya vavrai]
MILKCSNQENKKIHKVNNLQTKTENHTEVNYNVVTGKIKINNTEIDCIIDTGANASLISENLAIKENLIINKNERELMTMANNQAQYSLGTIENLKIYINDIYYTVKATVISCENNLLLLGTNFLSKYDAIIDLKDDLVYISKENDYNCFKINSKNINLNYQHNEKNKPKILNTFSKEKITLQAGEQKLIEIYPEIKNYESIPENSFLITKSKNKDFYWIGKGIYDCNKPPSAIFIANISTEPQIIEKGEKITELEMIQDAQIIFPEIIKENVFDIEKLTKSYKGDILNKNKFVSMLEDVNQLEITRNKIPIKHDLKLMEGSEDKIKSKPY